MPIIYIKNPRSGSHFRHIGGTKGGRPMRGGQRKFKTDRRGIRSVGWASCSTPSGAKWAHYMPRELHKDRSRDTVTRLIGGILWTLFNSPHPNPDSGFSRPCR